MDEPEAGLTGGRADQVAAPTARGRAGRDRIVSVVTSRVRRLACAAAGWLAGVVVLAGAGTTAQLAQDAPPPWRTRTDVVWVFASVTHRDGRPVPGLSKEDFRVFDDGVEQSIGPFTASRVPVSLGLIVDVSESMRGQRVEEARMALDRFLKDLLRPEDEAFLMTFNHAPSLVAGWSSPPSALAGRLDTVVPRGGTAIYDALSRGLPHLQQRKHQRAAIVVISDGADTASDKTLYQIRSDLRRSDGFVYALAIEGEDQRPSTRVNPEALRAFTDESGGYTAVVKDIEQLGAETSRIAAELDHQYLLGYDTPRQPDGEYHSIRVRVKREGMFVRARRGYLAAKK